VGFHLWRCSRERPRRRRPRRRERARRARAPRCARRAAPRVRLQWRRWRWMRVGRRQGYAQWRAMRRRAAGGPGHDARVPLQLQQLAAHAHVPDAHRPARGGGGAVASPQLRSLRTKKDQGQGWRAQGPRARAPHPSTPPVARRRWSAGAKARASTFRCQQRECTVGTWVGATVGRGGGEHAP